MNKKIPEITVNIFGTDYSVKQLFEEESPVKLKNASGYTELYSKEIIIETGRENCEDTWENFNDYKLRALRHELFHTIFYECGLDKYSIDEQLVDFLAIQFPKLVNLIEKTEDNFFLTNRNVKEVKND